MANFRNLIDRIRRKIFKLAGRNLPWDSQLDASVAYSADSMIAHSVLGAHCSVGPGAAVTESTLGHHVHTLDHSMLRKCEIKHSSKIFEHARLYKMAIGSYTYIARECNLSEASIGNFCSIGPRVFFGGGIHPAHFVSTSPFFYSPLHQCGSGLTRDSSLVQERQDIIVGHDVWIGTGAYVRDGVKIGTGSIIAAGATVVRDVAPYAIVGGVPAKLIRYRFSPEVIEELLQSHWWEWKFEKLQRHGPDFVSGKIEEFLLACRAESEE